MRGLRRNEKESSTILVSRNRKRFCSIAATSPDAVAVKGIAAATHVNATHGILPRGLAGLVHPAPGPPFVSQGPTVHCCSSSSCIQRGAS